MKVKKTNSNSLHLVNTVKIICYYIVLIILTYSSLNFSIKKKNFIQILKGQVFWAINPFLKTASMPFDFINGLQNKNHLETEKSNINQAFLNVQIEKVNLEINELYNFKKAIILFKLEKFDLIFFNPKYYSSLGLLTDVIFLSEDEEKAKNIKINSAVIASGGIYGRISNINNNQISVISIFNINSRIPVYTKTSNIFGVAFGNGFEIYFTYPNETLDSLIDGEEVWTSGENDLIISEIPFGTLKKIDNKYVIIPFVKTRPNILGVINGKHDR